MELFLIILFGCICLYVLSMMPHILHRPDFSPFKGRYYAHRGLHNNQGPTPENTLAAFQKAIDQGFGFECDVQLTKDLVPVVFHDFTLERVCKKPGKISDYTWEELKDFTICQSQEHIPLFSQVLELVKGQVPMIIEIKSISLNMKICRIVDELLSSYEGAYCIESFNPQILYWYKKHRPEIIRGQLSTNYRVDGGHGYHPLFLLLTHLMFNFLAKPDFIAYNCDFPDCLPLWICRKLYRCPIVAWTVSNQKELSKLRGKYDFYIFEDFIPKSFDS